MDLQLHGKYALVCGASKGIGRAAAEALAGLGANVTLVSRTPEALMNVAKSLPKAKGQQHDYLVADMTDTLDLSRKVKGLLTVHPIHILVNNTAGPAAGPVLDASAVEFMQAFEQHIICAQVLSQILVPGMKAGGWGRIVNVISTSVKEPIEGLGVSNTIRGAMGNWAKTLAGELAPYGITVNNVLPGSTETERLQEIFKARSSKSGKSPEEEAQHHLAAVPAGRFAQPHEIGSAIAFLASPAASYINGINLPVDGGRTRSL